MARVTNASQIRHLENEAQAIEKMVYKALCKLDTIQEKIDALRESE